MKVIMLMVKLIWRTAVILSCLCLIFVNYKANQPMSITEAPVGMTYVEFIQDRLDAAKAIQPSQCGWGMMLSLASLGPVYSVLYTEAAIHPGGFLAKVTAPDPDIPTGVAGADWAEIPDIWWGVVERLSWTMLGEPATYGCKFRPVQFKSE
ncbi:MAG: hypothetical protein JEZ00_20380 [Anaerolineaceae bacterium]|nr:hypothetical protein [Anaerolineaceae bacterium]